MSVAVSMPHTDSGLTVNLPNPWFQFEGSKLHIVLSNTLHLKEMDFGFSDSNGTVWLVELKNFNHPAKPVELSESFDTRLEEFFKKSVSSVLMVNLVPNAMNTGINLSFLNSKNKIKLVHIVNIAASDTHYIAAMQTKLETRLREFRKIFPIESISVLPYELAKQLFSWVI